MVSEAIHLSSAQPAHYPIEYPAQDYPATMHAGQARQGLSAIVLTKNEEKWIGRCLKSLLWADEILVIDAESTDATASIVQSATAPWNSKLTWMSRTWTGFRDQRNFALSKAKNDWVLIVDADECVSPELSKKILGILGAPPSATLPRAYKVRRIEFFLGRPIFHGIWNPSYQDRFFNRTGVSYVNDVHEYPQFRLPPGELHEPILHAPDFHPEKFLEKMNRYTTIEARDRVAQGRRTNLIHLLGAFPAMFLKNYIYYGAYKDGWHGLIISLLEGISRVVRHIKMWQFQQDRQAK